MTGGLLPKISSVNALHRRLKHNIVGFPRRLICSDTVGSLVDDDPSYADIPKPPKRKTERKPYPTPMKVLIRRAKDEKKTRKGHPCRMLEKPPDNGLLVPELVTVAREVYLARESLLLGLSKLAKAIPIKRCRFCQEVHIGRVGHDLHTCTGPNSSFRWGKHVWRKGRVEDLIFFPHCFHLYDRVGKPRVIHNERWSVPRLPAIVELCIQAGLELEKFPTKRRSKPVYCIEGRIVDFEEETENDTTKDSIHEKSSELIPLETKENSSKLTLVGSSNDGRDLGELGICTMKMWFEMLSSTKELMRKYKVNTCGYCPEVQVGPKGHKVRMCKASKHQSRDGMHAWQEARIDDLIGPNYVWHVRDPHGPPLENNLKSYYGKAPAVVEMCVQAGTPVPEQYRSMMRLEVVLPDRDEVDLVA